MHTFREQVYAFLSYMCGSLSAYINLHSYVVVSLSGFYIHLPYDGNIVCLYMCFLDLCTLYVFSV